MRNKRVIDKKKKFLIILFVVLLIMFVGAIFFTKTSICQCLVSLIILFVVLFTQKKTGNTALMYLSGLISAIVCFVLVIILGHIAKNNDIIAKIITFPH